MAVDIIEMKSKPANSGLPTMRVIGVGGGGGNVVNRMVNDGIEGVHYIAANTDMMVLNSSKADVTIPMGTKITKGLGAGMKPEVGKMAAEEDIDTIKSVLENTDLVFIAAGMGGGTGTGAAPVIAEIAKEMKVLTVGVVTTPFDFEGNRRAEIAEDGIEELKKHVDTLMVIPNTKLLDISTAKTTMNEAFCIVDDVLKQAISGITKLINMEGVINLDFSDLRTVMQNKGRARMGTGVAKGKNRGVEAAKKAISSPLLSDTPISGARGVIINIVADVNFPLFDAKEAAKFIQSSADHDADVIFGLVNDDKMEDEVIITVIATGFDNPPEEEEIRPSNVRPLRIVDSLKHRDPENAKRIKAGKSQEGSDDADIENEQSIPGRKIMELDPQEVEMQPVEDELHYPSRFDSPADSDDEPKMDLRHLDIPSFLRKKRLK